MSLSKAMDILSSGMHAQRVRLDVTSSNLANANTTRTKEGGAYRRMDPVVSATPIGDGEGGFGESEFDAALRRVDVVGIQADSSPLPQIHDPGHPDADPVTGMVTLPNVNVVEEMVNMITAARSYEANVTAFETLKQMAVKAMDIGK